MPALYHGSRQHVAPIADYRKNCQHHYMITQPTARFHFAAVIRGSLHAGVPASPRYSRCSVPQDFDISQYQL
jgi:hypothetical protein